MRTTSKPRYSTGSTRAPGCRLPLSSSSSSTAVVSYPRRSSCSRTPEAFLTHQALGYDPLADKGPLLRGASEAVPAIETAPEAADNREALEVVRSIIEPDPIDSETDENGLALEGLEEVTLELRHERVPYA